MVMCVEAFCPVNEPLCGCSGCLTSRMRLVGASSRHAVGRTPDASDHHALSHEQRRQAAGCGSPAARKSRHAAVARRCARVSSVPASGQNRCARYVLRLPHVANALVAAPSRHAVGRTPDASDHHALSREQRRQAAVCASPAARNCTHAAVARRCARISPLHVSGESGLSLVSSPLSRGERGQAVKSGRLSAEMRACAR